MAKDAKWYAGWVRLANAESADEKLTNLETAEFIESLAAELETVKREREFLLNYLTNSRCVPCDICKHEPENGGIMACDRVRKVKGPCFEWRGMGKEKGGSENEL